MLLCRYWLWAAGCIAIAGCGGTVNQTESQPVAARQASCATSTARMTPASAERLRADLAPTFTALTRFGDELRLIGRAASGQPASEDPEIVEQIAAAAIPTERAILSVGPRLSALVARSPAAADLGSLNRALGAVDIDLSTASTHAFDVDDSGHNLWAEQLEIDLRSLHAATQVLERCDFPRSLASSG